jgi:nucleoside-diphosphate-sugar epimerase
MAELSSQLSPLRIAAEDLQRCHDILGISSWQSLAGLSIFITGGTGFIGKWLLASLIDADHSLSLNCRITVLSRNPSAFERSWPALTGHVNWVAGDVRDFPIRSEHFDVIIHAAADVASQVSSAEMFSTCLDGTRRVLQLAAHCGASRLLLVSSGAIYGPLPSGMTHVKESHLGGPDPLLAGSAYAEGKRVSEWLCAASSDHGLQVKIARVFALVGPHLPLNAHFAIGNFLRAAMAGEQIVIQGDGTPYRSYLYAADMAAWLWAVLIKGASSRAYNVGSDESISIAALAEKISCVMSSESKSTVRKQAVSSASAVHYVPDISRSMHELRLPAPLPLEEAILRTARWYS